MAAVPPRRAPTTPNRAVTGFTIGTGQFQPKLSSTATSPNTADLTATPSRINTLGVDSQTGRVAVPALAAGASYVLRLSIPLPSLPGLTTTPSTNVPGPTATGPFSTRPQDTATFTCAIAAITNPIAGLTIASQSATPQAKFGAQTFAGPTLQSGINYTSFLVFVSLTVTAVTNTSAGTISVTANGHLTLQST